ncbi:MAG TPA: SUF system NifU family Fe-S cluster assembly protein [Actinomycetes bacterium]|nr:SUF system NifU family Fe-S cluster assembly protein [Actinomycetes bacterium]
MGLEDLYQEIILDHYKKPRHPGRLEGDRVEVRHYNPVCGDELTLGLRLDGDRVAGVAVDGKGCAISLASASVMSDLVLGRRVPEALEAADAFRQLMHGEAEPDEELLEDGIAFAGVARYPVRVKCALLGWMAFRDAAARGLAGQDGGETVYGEDENAARAAKAERLPGERY